VPPMSEEAGARFQRTVLRLQVRMWRLAVVVLVIGVVIGLLAWIVASHIKLPEHFWDGFGGAVIGAVLGAIVGGTLAAGGGYVATKRIRRLDIQRADDQDKRDYRAAVIVVNHELYANRAVAQNLTQGQHFVTDPGSIGLSDASYLRVEHFLADRLPETTRNVVGNAYAEIRARDTLFGPIEYQAIGGGSAPVRKARQRDLETLVDWIERAIKVLETEQDSWRSGRASRP
jgi:hypothetical protein